MWRAMAIGLLAMSLTGCLSGLGASSNVPAGMVPDPAYRANIGDRAVLYGSVGGSPMEQMPLLRDMTTFDQFERLAQAKDTQELTEMEEKGHLTWTPIGTRIIVLSIHDRTHTGSRVAAEVRPIDGPKKDHKVWVPLEYVARLHIPPPPE